MRQVGTLESQPEAALFTDYLRSLGIRTQVDREDQGWTIWVIDEDRVAQGREELAAFRKDPRDPRFAAGQSEVLRRESEERKRPVPKVVNLRDRWRSPTGIQPLVLVLLAISILVSVFTSFGAQQRGLQNQLKIAPATVENLQPGPFPAPNHLAEVRRGEVWRLVTPIFLHFGILHVVFNLMWLQTLGNAIEFRRGTWAATGLVLAIAIISNLAEYEVGVYRHEIAPGNFGGMSGVVYGLFGYIWVKSRFDPSAGLAMSSQTVMLMMIWFVVCFTGLVGPIANTAHTAGLVTGAVLAFLPILFRK